MGSAEYDVIVVGTGPAGLQAAIHAARRLPVRTQTGKRRVLVLGRAHRSHCAEGRIENLFGFAGTEGAELVGTGREQAAGFGAEFREEDAMKLRKEGDRFTVNSETGDELRAKAVVLAMGVTVDKLKVPGEKELTGLGVSYCVDCDGPFYRNRRVVVTGDGSAAAEGVLALLAYASEVHLVSPGLDVAEKLRDEVESSGAVRHVPDSIMKIVGEDHVEAVELASGGRLDVDGVFIELGGKGALGLTAELGVELDPESFKYIVVDRSQRTNVDGLFAAGDVTGRPWQVAKAVGEGCVAGLGAAKHARELDSAAGSEA